MTFLLENLLIAFWVRWVCDCVSWAWVCCSLPFCSLAVCIPRRFLKWSLLEASVSCVAPRGWCASCGAWIPCSSRRSHTSVIPPPNAVLQLECGELSYTRLCIWHVHERSWFRTFLHCHHEPSSLMKNVKSYSEDSISLHSEGSVWHVWYLSWYSFGLNRKNYRPNVRIVR